jgi:hypothetical protein
MTTLLTLHQEFMKLRFELFAGNSFVEQDDTDPRWPRYSQLLGYFYPCYRTKDWVNPAEEIHTVLT